MGRKKKKWVYMAEAYCTSRDNELREVRKERTIEKLAHADPYVSSDARVGLLSDTCASAPAGRTPCFVIMIMILTRLASTNYCTEE